MTYSDFFEFVSYGFSLAFLFWITGKGVGIGKKVMGIMSDCRINDD